MSRLEPLLERLAERPIGGYARAWAGALPRDGKSIIASVASAVGLNALGREGDFQSVRPEDAAVWLTLFATQPLLHGGRSIPPTLIDDVSESLEELGPDARYFSKGSWQYTRRFKHYELVKYDVIEDGGIIGVGLESAFIYWVEEDD